MERRLLQGLIFLCALIPLTFGALGLLHGLERLMPAPPVNADNVYRFLSGLYFTVGVLFLWVIPRVEAETVLVRILSGGVALGALGRVLSMLQVGRPALLFQIDVAIETIIPLVVVLWQARLARQDKPTAR